MNLWRALLWGHWLEWIKAGVILAVVLFILKLI